MIMHLFHTINYADEEIEKMRARVTTSRNFQQELKDLKEFYIDSIPKSKKDLLVSHFEFDTRGFEQFLKEFHWIGPYTFFLYLVYVQQYKRGFFPINLEKETKYRDMEGTYIEVFEELNDINISIKTVSEEIYKMDTIPKDKVVRNKIFGNRYISQRYNRLWASNDKLQKLLENGIEMEEIKKDHTDILESPVPIPNKKKIPICVMLYLKNH